MDAIELGFLILIILLYLGYCIQTYDDWKADEL